MRNHKKTMPQLILIAVVIIILWSLSGYFSSRVEHSQYSVLEKKHEYEIRLYPAHIVAQTTVTGPYREALSDGFRIVAGYIFGNNTKKQTIAMTAPVLDERKSEKIAMTAPVLATRGDEAHVISFGMPQEYTLDTLPVPNDSRVKIVMIPEKKYAARRFSWWSTESRFERLQKELQGFLIRDGLSAKGEAIYAGYNAPWNPPWMNRNEILIEVE
jgi:hypothetical protein